MAENENTTTESSERPESKTEKSDSDHINPISLRYLREAWKQLKEESSGTLPSSDRVVERAARNKLKGSEFTSKELDDAEVQMAITLERAIAKRGRDKKLEAQKGGSVSTIMPEEPPTEFWEDFPEMTPDKQQEKGTVAKSAKPSNWYADLELRQMIMEDQREKAFANWLKQQKNQES